MDPLGVCKHHHAAAQKDFARKQCKGFVFWVLFFFFIFFHLLHPWELTLLFQLSTGKACSKSEIQ